MKMSCFVGMFAVYFTTISFACKILLFNLYFCRGFQQTCTEFHSQSSAQRGAF